MVKIGVPPPSLSYRMIVNPPSPLNWYKNKLIYRYWILVVVMVLVMLLLLLLANSAASCS